MLTKWLAILLVGWVLRHGYFASQLGTPDFTKDMARDGNGNGGMGLTWLYKDLERGAKPQNVSILYMHTSSCSTFGLNLHSGNFSLEVAT